MGGRNPEKVKKGVGFKRRRFVSESRESVDKRSFPKGDFKFPMRWLFGRQRKGRKKNKSWN